MLHQYFSITETIIFDTSLFVLTLLVLFHFPEFVLLCNRKLKKPSLIRLKEVPLSVQLSKLGQSRVRGVLGIA